MKQTLTALLVMLLLSPTCLFAAVSSDETPEVNPKMTIEEEDGPVEATEYSGSAPLVAHFTSNIEDSGEYTPLYEWKVYKDGSTTPYLIRYESDFDFTFRESGSNKITLQVSFVNGADTLLYEMPTDFKIEVSTSVLNVPNGFSPNGDGTNDIFRVKQDYKSIVEFHGYIFNRNGKKLFEWTDITQGWDGTYHGTPVADGAYFVRIDAKGADGRHYDIKKAVNLLRGYTYNSTGGQ